jgi:hypothetical protein
VNFLTKAFSAYVISFYLIQGSLLVNLTTIIAVALTLSLVSAYTKKSIKSGAIVFLTVTGISLLVSNQMGMPILYDLLGLVDDDKKIQGTLIFAFLASIPTYIFLFGSTTKAEKLKSDS